MKKLVLSLSTFALIAASIFVFASCENEENTDIQTIFADKFMTKKQKIYSYDGHAFLYDSYFQNPYTECGLLHNELVQRIFLQWNTSSIPINDFPSIVEYTINSVEQMTNTHIHDSIFVDEMIKSFLSDTSKSYIESLKLTLHNGQDNEIILNFINDVEFITYKKEFIDTEQIANIKIVEQKISHSEINEETKNICLIFCAVYKSSYNNLIEMTSNPENNLCYAKKITGDMIIADAVGAAKGAYKGYKVGKFAGPQATAAMATIGAIGYGSLSTATEVGLTQNVSRLIDKGLNELRNKFNISL